MKFWQGLVLAFIGWLAAMGIAWVESSQSTAVLVGMLYLPVVAVVPTVIGKLKGLLPRPGR